MRRFGIGVVGALGLLVAVLFVRAAPLTSKQLRVPPGPRLTIDTDGLTERLAGSLRFPTISYRETERMDPAVFRSFHAYLERSFPAVHATLERETVADLSLLFTWPGRDPSLRPVLWMGHMDVVPIEDASASEWIYPPFGGEIRDGFIWGRGAIDDKADIICMLEAIERSIERGFHPDRSFYLFLGHDEEVQSVGAEAAVALLESRGVELEYVLDEGGGFLVDGLSILDRTLAPLVIAEKGSVSFELIARGTAGHSSVPPRNTAAGILAAAVVRLEGNPMPANLGGTVRLTLDFLAPELPFGPRLVLGNLWLFETPLRYFVAQDRVIDALARTTTAVTILQSGVKANVVPQEARAVVNHRILPGDSVEGVRKHVVRTVDDDRVEVRILPRSKPRGPSPVSRIDSAAFSTIQRTVAERFPEAVLIPALSTGGTDARFFHRLTDSVYRLTPIEVQRETLQRAHGLNERVPVASLPRAVAFYSRLMEASAGPMLP